MQHKSSTREEYLKRINVMIEYINNHLGENIDLNLLAEMSGFSPWHFHRITKAFLHEPIGTFIVRTRIETAARLLRYSDMPVQEVAYRVGYDAPSSLSKTFRQFYGISPIEYRNNKNFVIMKPIEIRPELNVNMRIETLKPKQVIYVRLTGEYASLNFCDAWNRLWRFVRDENTDCSQTEFICIYHNDPKVTEAGKLQTDVCLTVSSPVSAKGEVGVKTIAGGTYVVFCYQGPYENLGAVYDTIYGVWLPESGRRPADAPGYEKYLNHPDQTPPEQLLTEICIPVE